MAAGGKTVSPASGTLATCESRDRHPVLETANRQRRAPLSSCARRKMDQQVERLWVGIDFAFAKRKRLPVVVALDQQGRVAPLQRTDLERRPPCGSGNRAIALGDPEDEASAVSRFAHDVVEYIDHVVDSTGTRVGRIAIDAPRRPPPLGRIRGCEQAMRDAGLSFIPTPHDSAAIQSKARVAIEAGARDTHLPEANRLWMIAGFRLFDVLCERYGEDTVIEVYPYAAFSRLGAAQTKKSVPEGFCERLRALARYSGWGSADELGESIARSSWGAKHDKADAYLCVVLAARASASDAFHGPDGDPLDLIWMPPWDSAEVVAATRRFRTPPEAGRA